MLLKADSEFAPDRIGSFARHQPHGRNQAVSGAQRVHHQIESFRQPFLELVEAPVAHEDDPAEGHESTSNPDTEANEGVSEVGIDRIAGDDETSHTDHHQPARAPLDVRLAQQVMEIRGQLNPQQLGIQPGNAAERRILAQVQDLIA